MQAGVFLVYEASALCAHDGYALAEVACETCGHNLCADCDRVLHKPSGMRQHARKPVSGGTPLVAPLVTLQQYWQDMNKLMHTVLEVEVEAYSRRRCAVRTIAAPQSRRKVRPTCAGRIAGRRHMRGAS